jgi:trans-aconitate 2-methyltransferase
MPDLLPQSKAPRVTGWNPRQYDRYAGERLRPAADLLARVELPAPRRVFDLGCGGGKATMLLRRRWPGADITGIDSSPAMLAVARWAHPDLTFQEAHLADWSPPAPADLLFSNAALQWLGDHPALLRRLMGQLAPGGILAVQMPRNYDQPSHRAILAAAEEGPWRDILAPLLRPSPVAPPAAYHGWLRPQSARVDIWETTYLHELSGDNPVAEWTKGTALKPLLDALPEELAPAFESAYRARIAAAYPPSAQGCTLFPFRRLFIIAERSAHA